MDRESGMDSASPRRVIAGRHHPLVKQVRRMARATDISSDGLVLLETVRLAEEALRSGAAIPKLLICSSTGGRNSTPRVRSLLKKFARRDGSLRGCSGGFPGPCEHGNTARDFGAGSRALLA